jgi:hypothetical protein
MSNPDFQIPRRDLSRLGGTKSLGCFDFGNGVADWFFGGGKRLSSLLTASQRCCCAHPWFRPPHGDNHFPCFFNVPTVTLIAHIWFIRAVLCFIPALLLLTSEEPMLNN